MVYVQWLGRFWRTLTVLAVLVSHNIWTGRVAWWLTARHCLRAIVTEWLSGKLLVLEITGISRVVNTGTSYSGGNRNKIEFWSQVMLILEIPGIKYLSRDWLFWDVLCFLPYFDWLFLLKCFVISCVSRLVDLTEVFRAILCLSTVSSGWGVSCHPLSLDRLFWLRRFLLSSVSRPALLAEVFRAILCLFTDFSFWGVSCYLLSHDRFFCMRSFLLSSVSRPALLAEAFRAILCLLIGSSVWGVSCYPLSHDRFFWLRCFVLSSVSWPAALSDVFCAFLCFSTGYSGWGVP